MPVKRTANKNITISHLLKAYLMSHVSPIEGSRTIVGRWAWWLTKVARSSDCRRYKISQDFFLFPFFLPLYLIPDGDRPLNWRLRLLLDWPVHWANPGEIRNLGRKKTFYWQTYIYKVYSFMKINVWTLRLHGYQESVFWREALKGSLSAKRAGRRRVLIEGGEVLLTPPE